MVDVAESTIGARGNGSRAGEPAPAPWSTRRGFLTLAGSTVVTIGAGTAIAGEVYAARRGVFASGHGPAYQPWQAWEDGSAPLRLVRAGILAANAHNAQAWQFAVSPNRIDVYADTSRGLGAVDTYRREMHLSAGCAIENVALAASAAGLDAAVTLAPGGNPSLLATIDLAAGTSRVSDLYRAIPRRHTDRASYQTGIDLPADVPVAMDSLSGRSDVRLMWLLTAAQRAEFSEVTVAATEAFIADQRQSRDDYVWYRGTWDELQRHRDGVTVDASGLSPMLRSLGRMVPASRASNDAYWLAGTRDRQLPTASAFAIILVRDAADIGQRLAAGRFYQRLHLWATARRLAMQPLNQLVERAERERATIGAGPSSSDLATLVSDRGWQPVMPFRIGYPTATAPASPRRNLHDVLVTR